MADDDRVFLTAEQVDALLKPGDEVHTFIQAGQVLVGANWPRAKLLAEVSTPASAEVAGPGAMKTGHGVIIRRGWPASPLFCEHDKTAMEAFLAAGKEA